MATTDEVLAEIDKLIGTPAPKAISPSVSTQPSLGADLLGNLDQAYTAQKFTQMEPSTSDILYEALVPSKKAAGETLGALGELVKTGAGYGRYGLSYLSPFSGYGSEYRASVRAEEEAAKKIEAQKDEDKRISLGLSPEDYANLKKEEANKTYRRIGGQLVVGLSGAELGAAAGTVLAPFTYGLSIPAGALIGAYLGSGTGELGVQSAEEAAGWSKPTTAMEKARMFSEAGTAGLVGEAAPIALKAGYKGTAKAAQAGREYLGPKTLEEALGTIQPAMEKAMPAAKVRSAYARGAAREQTSGMRTTGELLGTPEALNVEQAIGLHGTQLEKYNIRLAENEAKSQAFILDDLSKNLAEESKAAKSAPKLSAEGKPIPETATAHLKTGTVSEAVIGDEMKAAFDDAAKQTSKELKPLYKEIEHVDTKFANIKAPINKALETYYPKVEGRTLQSGVKTTEFSGLPSNLKKTIDDILSTKSASTDDLNKWQSQLRSMGESFARAGNKEAASAAGDVRTILVDKINSTTAGQKWSGARAAARERANLIENHELGKVLTKEDLNGETIFKKVTSSESNAKNFIAIAGENHPVVRAAKAYAIKTVQGIQSAAKKATWIENNQKWLKHFMTKSELDSLNEIAKVGRIAGEKLAALTPQRGSPTFSRAAAAKEGLSRILGRGTDTVSSAGKAAAAGSANVSGALKIGGGLAAGSVLAGMLGTGQTTPYSAAAIIAAALAGKKIGVRRGAGTDLLREAAYEIAMNPKIAGYQAPQLAKALAATKAAQLAGAAKAGMVTGRAAQAGTYAGRLLPKKEETSRQAITPTGNRSAQSAVADAIKQLESLDVGSVALPTPALKSVKRVPISQPTEADADAHLSTKPALIQAMALAESGSQKDKAISPKGARGRMQLMPETAKELGVDINNPIANIDAGEKYVNRYIKKYGDERIALAAYNWGPGRIESVRKRLAKRGADLTWENIKRYASLPQETETYIARVIKNKRKFART